MALPWIFVSKITNYKRQISNKSQIAIFNDQNSLELRYGVVWIFEFWLLGFVWNLQFDIWDFDKSMNCQQSKSPLGLTKAPGPLGQASLLRSLTVSHVRGKHGWTKSIVWSLAL
jgi:hypothetical protein